MKNMHLIAVFGLAVLTLPGCAPKELPVLRLYTWPDYLNTRLVEIFEQAHNCRVEIDTFASNEAMYANVKAGRDGYDIIFSSSYQVSLMAKSGMLRPFDMDMLPNVTQNFDSSFRNVILDPKMTYSVPYALAFAGLAYRKDKVGGAVIDSWASLDNPAFAGRGSLLDDPRMTIGAALKSLGYSLNTTNREEIQKAKAVVLGWKKNGLKFDNEQRYGKNIASGELSIAHGFNCIVLQMMFNDEENIAFVYPKEGFAAICDEMVIPVTAKEVGLAHAFINFLYMPDNARRNIEYTCAPMPNRPGLTTFSERYRGFSAVLLPFPEVMARAEVVKDLGDAKALYSEVWDEIKAVE